MEPYVLWVGMERAGSPQLREGPPESHGTWGAAWLRPRRGAPRAGYLRPLLRPDVEGVSHGPLLGELHAASDKLGVDLLLHEHPGGRRAALALVEEHSLVGTLHCQVHWREGVRGGGGQREAIMSLGRGWQQLQL